MQRYVVLENIRSAHNVGAIFRTADGAGVSKIFIVGYTPAPVDRFGREQAEIKKTSLGATTSIAWEYHETIESVIENLKAAHISLVAVEQTENTIPYTEHNTSEDVAFVFGNEVDGVSLAAIAAADHVIEIPMSGMKESLNVATTAGIILFNHRDS